MKQCPAGLCSRGAMHGKDMKINITEDTDLRKIAESGQCFRAYETGSAFIFIAKDKKIRLTQQKDTLSADCTESDWNGFWKHYFDLDRDYAAIRKKAAGDPFMSAAAEAGKGIRILKQDPWEMLISFIISQRKSIPAIRTSIERLCEAFGEDMGDYHAFPAPKALYEAEAAVLQGCGLGYRLEYIRDAASKVYLGELDLDALFKMNDEDLQNTLKSVKGVGDKVANCVMLFAYGRTAAVPVDTWIKKIIEEDYNGKNPFTAYKEDAGIMQQYAFFYKRTL